MAHDADISDLSHVSEEECSQDYRRNGQKRTVVGYYFGLSLVEYYFGLSRDTRSVVLVCPSEIILFRT